EPPAARRGPGRFPIPLAALERTQVTIPITDQLLDAVGQPLRVVAAVEHAYPMPARNRVRDMVRPDKPGAAENQDAKRFGGARNRRQPATRADTRGAEGLKRREPAWNRDGADEVTTVPGHQRVHGRGNRVRRCA